MEIPAQKYEVEIKSHPLDPDNSIQITVTQAGYSEIGVANAETIAEAFDLAHEDYVEQIS